MGDGDSDEIIEAIKLCFIIQPDSNYFVNTVKSVKTDYLEKIAAVCATYPGKAAVFDAFGEYATYGDFVHVHESVSSFLIANEIKAPMRIAVITDNVLNFCLMLLPVLDHASFTSIDPGLDTEKFEFYFKLLSVDYILTDIPEGSAREAAAKSGTGIISFKSRTDVGKFDFEFSMEKKPIDNPGSTGYRKDDIVYIATTSGTTSVPKIVPYTSGQAKAALKSKVRNFDFTEDDITLIITKAHRLNSFNAMLISLYTGGRAIMADGFVHEQFFSLLDKYRVTNFTATPAVLSSLADYIENNHKQFEGGAIRFIRSSGAPLPKNLKERIESIFKTRVVQSYGMTETNNISSTYFEPCGYKEGSAGISSGLEIKIKDDEILVRGDTVFSGHENDMDDRKNYFEGEWFRTGDMGYIDDDGYVFITGRIKEMINKGGEKISPYEVENEILRHPLIKEAVVFPYPNAYGSENAGAVVVTEDDRTMELAEIRSFLTGRISYFKMPTLLYCVDEIPKSENSKVRRKTLFEYLDDKYPMIADKSNDGYNNGKEPGLTKTQRMLRRIWIRNLKISKIGIDDNFSGLGGDSLNGAAILAEIESKMSVQVPVSLLFGEGTIRAVDDYINACKTRIRKFRFLVPVKESGTKKPLICIHSGIGDATTYRYIGQFMESDRPVYGLRFDSHREKWPYPLDFDYIGRIYADEIKQLDPEGPYFLCGNCWGGVLAFRIASVLKDDGCRIGMLAMFDSAARIRDKYDQKNRRSLLNRLARTFRESVDQLRGKKFTTRVAMIAKKTLSIFKMLRTTVSQRIYRFGGKHGIKFLMRLTGKTGALGYAYQKYKPEPYCGKIHYFKAMKGRSTLADSQEYWSKKADELLLIEMNCHHNDIVVGDFGRILTEKMVGIMKESDV
ncbi:MAG: AMP-binding protein [Clostridia bacterium]